MVFIFAYANIYKRLKAYHDQAIQRFSSVYSYHDIEKMHQSTREVLTYFSYIVFMLLMQSGYLLNKVFVLSFEDSKSEKITTRLQDILIILMQISHIMMNVGVSLSIQKAYKA